MRLLTDMTKLIFAVHKHHATHLHYDLRLEMKGVLESWAVPKGMPLKKGEKRLAIITEPHSISYAKFCGEIPEGNYGAGKVEIWDSGTYEPIEVSANKIHVKFSGKKLKGEYALIKFNRIGEKNWLVFKK